MHVHDDSSGGGGGGGEWGEGDDDNKWEDIEPEILNKDVCICMLASDKRVIPGTSVPYDLIVPLLHATSMTQICAVFGFYAA